MPQESAEQLPSWRRARPALAIALVYLAAHVWWLAPSPEDIDSVNFALGLHDYDPAGNRPHPPGYPVYIATGRVALGLVHVFVPGADSIRADGLALAVVSVVAAVVALVAAWFVFSALRSHSSRVQRTRRTLGSFSEATSSSLSEATWATALLAASPLFWMMGLRPMSDMPGLAVALVTQALLLQGLHDRRAFVMGACAAGIAIGVRSQVVWLTLPLFVLVLFAQRRAGLSWLVTRPVAALAGGALAWAIPMLLATGPSRYLGAIRGQAGDDFSFVDMLWLDPTPRHLVRAVRETLLFPWVSPSLGAALVLIAIIGLAMMLWRDRRAVAIALVAFGPYAAFHLLFQETQSIRYALPVLPVVAVLVAHACAGLGRLAPLPVLVAVGASLVIAIPGGRAYGQEAHPVFRAIRDMTERAAAERPGALFVHHALGQHFRVEAASSLPRVEPRIRYEWLGPVEYWRRGGASPVWFLGDPRRTDLALIDPQSRHLLASYRWRVAERPEFGGARPLGADWYRIDPPGWFAGEGWSLSLEAGGVTIAGRKGLDHRPIEAYVRRRSEPTLMLIGGRDLGAANVPFVLAITLDDRPVESWRVDPAASGANFLRMIELPAGVPAGAGGYAHLVISARAEAARAPTPPVAIRQFDVQSGGNLMYAFGEGWHEEEAEASSSRRWRWTSERSVLQVLPAQGVEIFLRGESPLKYFDVPPTVRLSAGDRLIQSWRPTGDFEWRVRVPFEDVRRSNGAITIETDRVYLPATREGTGDMRHLGLRLFEIRIDPT